MERNKLRWKARHLNRILFALAALMLLAVGAFSHRQWEQFRRANAEAAQTRESVDALDQLLSSVTDAETGQRGYLLTGQDRYLDPYNRALQTIPSEIDTIARLLAGRANESENLAKLKNLVDLKLTELRQTIDLRRTGGFPPAMAIVLSDRGEQAMDEIRVLIARIRSNQLTSQAQTSTEGEAAAQTALLAAVASSLVLLFLFSFGLEPFASPDPQAQRRSWPMRYGVAILAVLVTVLFRAALTPLMGGRSMPFTLFFPAVWFAAWFGGLRPGALSVALSALAGSWFFAEPTKSLLLKYHDDQVAMLMLVIVGLGMSLLSRSQQKAVTRAMQAESAERMERQRFETTLASIGDAVIVTDAAGHVTFSNQVALSLTGWEGDEASGQHLEDVFRIVNEYTRAKVENPAARVVREGTIAGLANHTILLARDGTEVPIDDSAAPIRGSNGAIQGAVLVFRDIAERRRAERLLAEQAAELRQKAHLMERACSFVMDLDDRIVYWNQGAADVYGFSEAEAVGQVSHALLKTEFPASLDEILAELMREGQWDGDLVHTCRDGRRLIMASHWALHRDAEDQVVSILEVNVDVTARKAAEEALHVSNAALMRANEDLSQFAFAASHDLQEPLRMITSYSQLLLKGYRGELDGEAATCVQFITEGSKRMRALLADLLAYTQVSGDGREASDAVDLNRVFQTALKNLQTAIDETGAVIESDNLPEIAGYEPHFVQLFQNLIGNSLKYRSERPPHIQVSANRQGGLWLIAIQDNGIGIAPEYHHRIFGVFKRLHGSTIPGTGIGLAICKRVVDRYGGQIWVESEIDQGATFYFTVPATGRGLAHGR